jgi:hypothetical protein
MQSIFHYFKIFFLLFFLSQLSAQKNEILLQSVRSLNQALLTKDSSTLQLLLHKDLSYGHSNGWIENKEELIRNNNSGYLIYKVIQVDSMHIQIKDKLAIARYTATHDIVLNGKSLSLKLHVCQTWLKQKRKWKLLARQSTKIS